MSEQPRGDAWRALELALIAGIAHHMNGALAGLTLIAGNARIDGALAPDLLGIMDDQIERLQRAVRLLFALEELDRSVLQLHDPNELALRSADLFHQLPEGKHTGVEVDGRVEAAVRATAGACVRALLLCMRAAAATRGAKQRGSVRLSLLQDAEYVVLQVTPPVDDVPLDPELLAAAARMLSNETGASLDPGPPIRLRLAAVS